MRKEKPTKISQTLKKIEEQKRNIKIKDTKQKMDHSRPLPDHGAQQNTTSGQEDEWGISIFATRSCQDHPEERTSFRSFHLPVETPYRT